LAQHFCRRFADRSGKAVGGISAEAAQKLLAYEWPGNVRELQNIIERAIALTTYGEVCVEDLPEKLQNLRPKQVLLAADDPNELVPLEEIERRYILKVYETVGGNKTLAAQILAVDRKTLYRKLEQYGVLKSSNRTASHPPPPITRA
jgi:two-component system response regulator HydG